MVPRTAPVGARKSSKNHRENRYLKKLKKIDLGDHLAPLDAILLHFGLHFDSILVAPGPQQNSSKCVTVFKNHTFDPSGQGPFFTRVLGPCFFHFFPVCGCLGAKMCQNGVQKGTPGEAREPCFSSLWPPWGPDAPPGLPNGARGGAKSPKWCPK